MGDAVEELKRVPFWGWIVVGLVVVAVIVAVMHARAKSHQTIGSLAQPQAADLSGLTATDTTQGNAALQELNAIDMELRNMGQGQPNVPVGPGMWLHYGMHQPWQPGVPVNTSFPLSTVPAGGYAPAPPPQTKPAGLFPGY